MRALFCQLGQHASDLIPWAVLGALLPPDMPVVSKSWEGHLFAPACSDYGASRDMAGALRIPMARDLSRLGLCGLDGRHFDIFYCVTGAPGTVPETAAGGGRMTLIGPRLETV